jgi:hypothetical protein
VGAGTGVVVRPAVLLSAVLRSPLLPATTPVVETGSRAGMGAGRLDLEWVDLGLAARLLASLLSYDAFMKDNHIQASDTGVPDRLREGPPGARSPQRPDPAQGRAVGEEAVTRSSGRALRSTRLARHVVGVTLAATTLAACVPVTVNITFPQEKLDDAASQIVDMSRQPKGAPPAPESPPPTGQPSKPGSSLLRWLAWFTPRDAAAAQAYRIDVAQAPKTDSAEVRRLT